MKKISSPAPNSFIPKDEPKTYKDFKDITIKDIEKFYDDMDEETKNSMITTIDLGNGKVQISSNRVFGIVGKKQWNDALQAAAKKIK